MKTQLARESGIKSNKPMKFNDLRKIFKEYSLDNIRDLNIDYNILKAPEMTPLRLAIQCGRADIVKYLLEKCNVNVNHSITSKFCPYTALELVKEAISNNNKKLENSTAEEGTNPKSKTLIEIKALLESTIQAISLTQDGSVQIHKSTDFDVFVSVYKNKLLETGFKGDFSSYLKTLKENESISAIHDKITDSLKEARDAFLQKCNDLFIAEGYITSTNTLSELISKKQQGPLSNEDNEQVNSLINFYTNKDSALAELIKNFLPNEAPANGITDIIAEFLQQKLYTANIKIIEANINNFLLDNAEARELIIDIARTALLPKSLNSTLNLAIENYNNLQDNPLICAMLQKIDALTEENAEQYTTIQSALGFSSEGPSAIEPDESPIIGDYPRDDGYSDIDFL